MSNKQLIAHVTAEVVILGVITIYFYRQHKALLIKVDEIKKENEELKAHIVQLKMMNDRNFHLIQIICQVTRIDINKALQTQLPQQQDVHRQHQQKEQREKHQQKQFSQTDDLKKNAEASNRAMLEKKKQLDKLEEEQNEEAEEEEEEEQEEEDCEGDSCKIKKKSDLEDDLSSELKKIQEMEGETNEEEKDLPPPDLKRKELSASSKTFKGDITMNPSDKVKSPQPEKIVSTKKSNIQPINTSGITFLRSKK